MFSLLVVLHAAEVPIYSVDAICYETTSKSCSALHATMTATGEEVGTEAGVRLNQFIYAAPSNATSALAKTTAEIVVLYVQNNMTGKDQDILDLAVLSQNVMLLFPPIVSGEDAPSMMKDLVADIGRIRNLGPQNGLRSMAKGAQDLAQLAATKNFNIKSAPRLHQCDPEWDPYFTQVHLTATSDVFSKVNTMFCYSSSFVFHAEIHIPCVVYYGFALGYMTNAQYFKPDYTLIPSGILSIMEYEGCGALSFKDLGLLEINRTDPVKLELTSTGWRLADEFSFIVPYKQVSGYFSVVEVSDIDVPLQVNVDAPNGAIEIKGFNVSVQAEINMGPPGYPMGAKTLQEKPKLIVTFDPDWDKKVSNTPEIIFEAADPNAIQVNQQPTKVSIKKTSVADRPSVPAPSSGGDDDPNKPDTGLIIGIVVAVIAVITIVVVIVVVVVMKKKKAQVEAESTHGVGNDSHGKDHNTNDQHHPDVDHPSPE